MFVVVDRNRGGSDSPDDALATIVSRPNLAKTKNGAAKHGTGKNGFGKNGTANNGAHLNQVIENDYVSDVNQRPKG